MLINDTSRPLIFLGTNSNLYQYAELCDAVGITVAGIMDSDYFGNTDTYCDLPVIDSESAFSDPNQLQHYKNHYNFFCAVNWSPIKLTQVDIRNRQKRQRLIDLIDHHDLRCTSLVSPRSCVAPSVKIGRGVFVDHMVNLESKVTVGDYTNFYAYTLIGHFASIGRNCVFQRHSVMGSGSIVEDDVYLSPMVKCIKGDVRIGAGTFIHEGVYIRRGTVPNEVVSLTDGNLSRVTALEAY